MVGFEGYFMRKGQGQSGAGPVPPAGRMKRSSVRGQRYGVEA